MAISNADLAQKISDLIDFWSNLTVEYKNWLGGSVAGGPNSDGQYPLTDFTGLETLVESPAKLSNNVGGFVTLAQSAETNAAASAVAALASENEATTQKGLADAARILAETARTTATTEAAASLNSSVNASASQAAALVSKDAALVSENAAAASAAAALVSELAAAASAAQAATFDPLDYYTRVALDAGQLDNRYFTETEITTKLADYTLTSGLSITNWNTAYGWGNHAGLYSLLAHTHTFASLTSKPTTIAGYGITDLTALIDANANVVNGVTAYGWGNHAGLYSLLGHVHDGIADTNLVDKTAAENISGAWNITGVITWGALNLKELTPSPVGNFGQFTLHGAFSDFNLEPTYWGWSFVQGTTNAPHTISSQWYRNRSGLGNIYGKGTDAGDYWLELAYPRYHTSGAEMWMRTTENGGEGAWSQVGSYIKDNFTVGGNATVTGTVTGSNLNVANWDTAYGWGNHAGLYSLLAHNHAGVYEPVDSQLPRKNVAETVTEAWNFNNGLRFAVSPAFTPTTIPTALPLGLSQVYSSNAAWPDGSWNTVVSLKAVANRVYQLAVPDVVTNGSAFWFRTNNAVGDGWESWNKLEVTGHSHVIADITDANNGNWDTAYGWGNHASGGYATSGHTHTGSTISALAAGDTTSGVFSVLRLANNGPFSVTPRVEIVNYNRFAAVQDLKKNTIWAEGIFGGYSSMTNGPTSMNYDPFLVLGNASDVRSFLVVPRTASRPIAYMGSTNSSGVPVYTAWHYTGWTTTAADANLSLYAKLASPTFTGSISITDANTKILEGAGNAIRVQTNSGYGDFGPQNTSWCHMVTDRAAFYFSPSVHVNGSIFRYLKGVYHYYDDSTYIGGKTTVAATAPGTPAKGDLWFDTS